MSILITIIAILSFKLCEIQARHSLEMNHLQHLPKFENLRYPLGLYNASWQEARNYIETSFKSYGLLTQRQTFQTKIASFENSLREISGVNIIGQSLSVDDTAPVLLIATYYDNTLTQNPLQENGASLATILESARIFQKLKREESFNQNITILFAAFDLNVKNYIPLGPGKPGSYFFVREFLMEYLNGRKFIGALILDSIGKFNLETYSQQLVQGFENAFPNNYKNIKESEFKANFLGIVSRGDEFSKSLISNFETAFKKENFNDSIHLENMVLLDGVKVPFQILDKIRRNSQYDFWTSSPPFPALFLTDMGTTRKSFDEEVCSTKCNVDLFWNQQRQWFVEQTTASIIEMFLSFQEMSNGHDSPEATEMPVIQEPKENMASTVTSLGFNVIYICSVLIYVSVY